MRSKVYDYTLVAFTFVGAFMLSWIPLGQDWKWLRPEWVALVLIYWVTYLPRSVGVFVGLSVGLLLDLCHGTLFGTMGLSLSVVAFLTHLLQMKFRVYRFGYQLGIIFVLVGIEQLIRLWIQLIVGHPPANLIYWLATLVSTLCWPVVVYLLQKYQRRLKIN